ncbi:MAG: hypothetical protein HC902_07725 [Calothrix sp. SM1_5_4]|nr:hypothetical protein [Calothrix sp. SM1_5_4]
MHPLLLRIRQAHQDHLAEVRRREEEIEVSSKPLRLLGEFFFEVADWAEVMHLWEERVLFPLVASKPNIRSGGPHCMLYLDMHHVARPFERAAWACSRTSAKMIQIKDLPVHLRNFFSENSPICIPVEDHLAMRQIRDRAREILREKTVSFDVQSELLYLMRVYSTLLKSHFDKEDNCFLVLCRNLLGDNELAELEAFPERG